MEVRDGYTKRGYKCMAHGLNPLGLHNSVVATDSDARIKKCLKVEKYFSECEAPKFVVNSEHS